MPKCTWKIFRKTCRNHSKNGPKTDGNRVQNGPGGSREVQNRQKLGSRGPGPGGVPGGSKAFPETQHESKKQTKKTGDGLRADFGRFLGDFLSILERFWVRGGQKAGLKRYRFSGTKKSRIPIKFSSKFESKKEHDFDTFQYTL